MALSYRLHELSAPVSLLVLMPAVVFVLLVSLVTSFTIFFNDWTGLSSTAGLEQWYVHGAVLWNFIRGC